ncbi:MAG: hypothetical protein ACYCSJ_11950, partial [Acidimicrobiales bacterium]
MVGPCAWVVGGEDVLVGRTTVTEVDPLVVEVVVDGTEVVEVELEVVVGAVDDVDDVDDVVVAAFLALPPVVVVAAP